MTGARGQEFARLLSRPRLYLDAHDGGRTYHSRDVPFDQLLANGLAEHGAQSAVDDLYRARAEPIGSFVGEQRANVGRSQRTEFHTAERRNDMQTQRLPVAREC